MAEVAAEIASVMPSRQPGAAMARTPRGPVGDSRIMHAGWPDDTLFASLPPESLSRVLDGLKNLR